MIEWIINHAGSGIVGFIIGTLAAALVAYLKFGRYVGVLYFLTTALKHYDEAVADVVPNSAWGKIEPVRKFIKRTIPAEIKAKLDEVLKQQGYING